MTLTHQKLTKLLSTTWEDWDSCTPEEKRQRELSLLKGRTVQEAMEFLDDTKYAVEITLFYMGGVWAAHPVGGPCDWLDTPSIAKDRDPATAVKLLLTMPALPIKEV